MKFFFTFLALVVIGIEAATLTDEQKQNLMTHHKECASSSGVAEAQLEAAKKGQYPDDPKFKAHLFCMSKKIGFQNDAGEIQKDVIIEKLTSILGKKDLAESLTEKCTKTEATPEETAFSCLKCYYENTPDHISLV